MAEAQELRSLLALTRVQGLGTTGAHRLWEAVGSAREVFEEAAHLSERVPGVQPRLVEALAAGEPFRRADAELEFAQKYGIRCIAIGDKDYPSRLRECEDAPLVLFYRGVADLNALRVLSVVGTRRATLYGKDICDSFMNDLSRLSPDVLVVSGLAYGIDIRSHRAALTAGLSTVAVLGHGLDRIYPALHRNTAEQMVREGGLLTEFMSGTFPDGRNFVRRNRIVAGMADAVVVVESAAKGGSLITAEMAQGYHKDCFAFSGRATDEYSEGCNRLIRDNKAALITGALDLVQAMNWDAAPYGKHPESIQRQLFVELNDEEKEIADILRQNPEGIQINSLLMACDMPINRLNAILFEMEMKGVVKALAGGIYKQI